MCCWTGYIWFSRLNRVYNFTSKHLEQGVFLDWKPFKDLWWEIYICNTNIFFLNIYFHNFGVKKHLTLYANQNKSGSESSVSYLKQGGKISNFCLKQGHGLKALTAQLYPDFPWGQSLLVLKGFKSESIRKLSNFNFQQTKALYQNNLNNIAFFFYIFQGLKI